MALGVSVFTFMFAIYARAFQPGIAVVPLNACHTRRLLPVLTENLMPRTQTAAKFVVFSLTQLPFFTLTDSE